MAPRTIGQKKPNEWAIKHRLLGYEGCNLYRRWHPVARWIVVSRDVTFDELVTLYLPDIWLHWNEAAPTFNSGGTMWSLQGIDRGSRGGRCVAGRLIWRRINSIWWRDYVTLAISSKAAIWEMGSSTHVKQKRKTINHHNHHQRLPSRTIPVAKKTPTSVT